MRFFDFRVSWVVGGARRSCRPRGVSEYYSMVWNLSGMFVCLVDLCRVLWAWCFCGRRTRWAERRFLWVHWGLQRMHGTLCDPGGSLSDYCLWSHHHIMGGAWFRPRDEFLTRSLSVARRICREKKRCHGTSYDSSVLDLDTRLDFYLPEECTESTARGEVSRML